MCLTCDLALLLTSACVLGFSWDALPENSVLVDVGGGIGATSIIVAENHPHMRVVVEDRAQTVSRAKLVRTFIARWLRLHEQMTDT